MLGNKNYIEAFALASRSLRALERGQLQAMGDDYAAARRHESLVQQIWNCFGGRTPLSVVFPPLLPAEAAAEV